MLRSPLIMGGNLLLCDEWTKSLRSNPEVIAVEQQAKGNPAVETRANSAAWVAEEEASGGTDLAVFQQSDTPQKLRYTWKELGLNRREYAFRDLSEHQELGHQDSLEVALPPHGSAGYLLHAQTKP